MVSACNHTRSRLFADTIQPRLRGFEGYITSDCDADADVFYAHSYLNQTAEEDVRDILRAGTDVDCGSFIGSKAQSALDNGTNFDVSCFL